MDKEISTTGSQNLVTTSSKKPFLEILQTNKRLDIAAHLGTFKQNGVINFRSVLSIEISQRIPQLVSKPEGRNTVLIALTVALKNALNNLNLKYHMNEDQLVELADAIIDQAHEDQLSLEDVVLFLQKMLAGEYATEKMKVDFKLDMPLFFQLFEGYRQERHSELVKIRHEQQVNHKVSGRFDDGSAETIKDGKLDSGTMLDLIKSIHMQDE
jgi:hypothetical protein